MSGIYGFNRRSLDCDTQILVDTLGGLEYWNRIYGREASESRIIGHSGIGCHVEHFSEHFPFGGPILDWNGCLAAVDALLFNRDELLEKLDLEQDSMLSDEELLLYLIEVKGFDALELVNGDFAGAILEPETGTCTLFRDHLGVRPLYLYLDDESFAFSTDMRGLAAIPNSDLEIDELYFYVRVIDHNMLQGQRTDFRRIREIMPGAVTRILSSDSGYHLEEQAYWSPRRRKIRLPSAQAYQQQLRNLITDSVHRRCDAIPGVLGAELSGGLDSSIIDILISRYGREAKFFSWSWDFDTLPLNKEEDERMIVQDICQQEQIECHFMNKGDQISLQSSGEHLIPHYINTLDLGHGSAWLRKQGAKVVFTGHGGDEGPSHRGRRYELFRYRELITYYKYYYQDLQGQPFRLLRALRAGTKDALSDQNKIRLYMNPQQDHSLFHPDFAQRISRQFVPTEFTFNYDPHLFVMQGGTRPRMANAAYQGAVHGVRYLFPYVDYRVMDFSLSIPRREFVGRDRTRVIFREAFRDIMPQSLYTLSTKRSASLLTIPREKIPPEAMKEYVETFLAKFNREEWECYLNFDRIKELLLCFDGSTGGRGSTNSLLHYLSRCIAIQDIRKNAKRWREFDE